MGLRAALMGLLAPYMQLDGEATGTSVSRLVGMVTRLEMLISDSTSTSTSISGWLSKRWSPFGFPKY